MLELLQVATADGSNFIPAYHAQHSYEIHERRAYPVIVLVRTIMVILRKGVNPDTQLVASDIGTG